MVPPQGPLTVPIDGDGRWPGRTPVWGHGERTSVRDRPPSFVGTAPVRLNSRRGSPTLQAARTLATFRPDRGGGSEDQRSLEDEVNMTSCELRESDRRIGIILLSGIGDVVHGLPVATAIKAQDPTREVVWVAEPAPAQVVQHHPCVDRVVVFQPRTGLSGVGRLLRDMRGLRSQVVLNMQRYFKSVPPLLAFRAPRRVGLAPSRTRDGIRFFHTHATPEGPWRHTQDLFLEFLDVLGVPHLEPPEWSITFTPAEEEDARAYFSMFDERPVAAVIVGSAHPAKDWPLPSYPELVEGLVGDLGYHVMLVGGADEREVKRGRWVAERTRVPVTLALEDSVRRLMWRLRGSDVVISPDSGPLHLAHAMDVPVVGLYGHTNPARVGPYRRFRDLVIDRYTEPGHEPDPADYEPRAGRMERIRPVDVLGAVQRARTRYGVGSRRGSRSESRASPRTPSQDGGQQSPRPGVGGGFPR